ncbi:hypothetical protein [Clostridium sp. C2-6-12]|uniref:hypothetical protein n=1 Tax=Clostridium sp. C2-6-12 TaxID=2698832 RepID=UPI00136A8859|nr:hypothetical protein [Clostridium sp. C2-6-12]
MIDLNQNEFDDEIKFKKFESTNFSYDFEARERPPFFPQQGNNKFPQTDNFPGNFDSPPEFNFPGGAFNPPGMPKSAPPNYTPKKNGPGVQTFSATGGAGTPSTFAVSSNSIRFCLYKYTYIWERSGRSYWTFLLNVDRRSVSGFRWTGRSWIYFGIDLRRIDSFVCYRSESIENCNNCENFRSNNIELENKIDYSINQIKDVYTQTLAYVDIPEVKEDYITRSIGLIDGQDVKSDIPCVKIRNLSYRITLEVAYPNNFTDALKKDLTISANDAASETSKIFNSQRNNKESSNPLETFNNSIALIPEALNTFTNCFNSKLQLLNLSSDKFNNITHSIRTEKIYTNWNPYFSAL